MGEDQEPSSTKIGLKQPWALPDVSETDVIEAAKELRSTIEWSRAMAGQNRKGSGSTARPVKRARRRSYARDEVRMSGALRD